MVRQGYRFVQCGQLAQEGWEGRVGCGISEGHDHAVHWRGEVAEVGHLALEDLGLPFGDAVEFIGYQLGAPGIAKEREDFAEDQLVRAFGLVVSPLQQGQCCFPVREDNSEGA